MASTPSTTPIPALQVPSFTAADLRDPDAAASILNSLATNYGQMINYILGHSGGPPVLKAGVDLNGATITNSGVPQSPSDVVSLEYADNNYGASAIQPALEALSKSGTFLQTYRQLNNPVQRERSSSFLNDLESPIATANTATISGVTSGSTVDVTVSSGYHQHTDGSNVPFPSRTDTFSLPAQFSIVSIGRTGNVVSADVSGFSGSVGELIGVYGTSDPSFQGIFTITGISGSTVQWNQGGPNGGATGGTLSALQSYYYTISKGQNQLGLVAANGPDSWAERLLASGDGTTIVGVAIVNGSGLDPINSAAGGTPPVTGASVPVIRRL